MHREIKEKAIRSADNSGCSEMVELCVISVLYILSTHSSWESEEKDVDL